MRQIEKEAIRLTNELLVRYWQKDYKFAISMCADDVVWIGSRQDEFKIGIKQTQADFEKAVSELQPCHLVNAEYHTVAASSALCTVIGRYLVTTDNTADYFLQAQQRCTFIWAKVGDELKIKHLHISNPLGELKIAENEAFPNTVGKMAYQYMMNHIKRNDSNKTLAIYGDGGSLHFLQLSEIVFVSALGKDSAVNTVHGEIFVKASITELAKQAGDLLVTVHRSYLVNPDYISSIERYCVTMQSGQKIPIPARKYNELRETLLKIHITD